MLQLRKLLAILVVLTVLLGLATSTALAQDPANGKTVWEEQLGCQRCHGPAGEGLWAGPLAGNEKTAQEWISQVRSPRRNMPAFSESQVSDQMIIDAHAHLTSLPKVSGFTPQDAGLPADAHPGQVLLVEKRCVACHTTTGPVNRFIDRGEMPTAENVIAQLRTPAKFMPSFSPTQVSDDEARVIAEFLAEEFSAVQTAPATLPQSGAAAPSNLLLAMALLLGGGLLLAGLVLRRLWA